MSGTPGRCSRGAVFVRSIDRGSRRGTVKMDTFIQQILNGLVLGSMYALVALGYTMVYGVLNLINFAHGDVLMIGAMTGLTILKLLNVYAPDMPGYIKLAIAIGGAIPVCMAVNILIERVAYRRLRNAPRL